MVSSTSGWCRAKAWSAAALPMVGKAQGLVAEGRDIEVGAGDAPERVALAREGQSTRVIVAQQERLVAATGLDVDILGDPQAPVVEAQQGVALGVVLAALCGGPAAKVGAFLLVGPIDGPHRALAQTGDPAQAIRQNRAGVADQPWNRRREDHLTGRCRQGIGPRRARQWGVGGCARIEMEQRLDLLAQHRHPLEMAHPECLLSSTFYRGKNGASVSCRLPSPPAPFGKNLRRIRASAYRP